MLQLLIISKVRQNKPLRLQSNEHSDSLSLLFSVITFLCHQYKKLLLLLLFAPT